MRISAASSISTAPSGVLLLGTNGPPARVSSSPEMCSIASRTGFGVESLQREVAEEPAVVGVDRIEVVQGGPLLWRYTADVRIRPVQSLHAPYPELQELRGKEVEQLRMRRRLRAGHSEAVRGRDDAGAEVVLPDAIHQYAREQRVVRRR